jgi:hypothetical protein
MLGLAAKLTLTLTGLLMMFGVFSIKKGLPPNHSLSRQLGKGLFILFGAILSYDMAVNFADSWNNWVIYPFEIICIVVSIIGLRIMLKATKKINGLDRQDHDGKN